MPRYSSKTLSPLNAVPPDDGLDAYGHPLQASFGPPRSRQRLSASPLATRHHPQGQHQYQNGVEREQHRASQPRRLPHSPAKATETLFDQLQTAAEAHRLVFRVHVPSSPSGLHWTGHYDYSGFFSYNSNLALPPSVYMKVFSHTPLPLDPDDPEQKRHEGLQRGWELGPYQRHTMVDHIMGKMKQGLVNIPSTLEERPGTPPDDKSNWISTTRSLFWAVWDVARRLALEGGADEKVNIAVITQEPADADDIDRGVGEKEGKVWDDGDDTKSSSTKLLVAHPQAKELWVQPGPAIRHGIAQGSHGRLSVAMKESYEIALKLAEESQEVLYHGRIFAERIPLDKEFTRQSLSSQSCPLELPAHFYRPRSSLVANRNAHHNHDHHAGGAGVNSSRSINSYSSFSTDHDASRPPLQGWLGKLVWDPRDDNFQRATSKVVERRRELFLSYGVRREDSPFTPT